MCGGKRKEDKRKKRENLESKRNQFEHYKNRAQTEMVISLQAEDKEAELRTQARAARKEAATRQGSSVPWHKRASTM